MTHEHLVTFEIVANRETQIIRVNTFLIEDVYMCKGKYIYSDDRISYKMYKKWKKKHPILSKIYTPYVYWDLYDWSEWSHPQVIIKYSGHKKSIKCKSNYEAEQVLDKIRNLLWK